LDVFEKISEWKGECIVSGQIIQLTADQKEKILRDIWILHDGRWFIKSIGEVGFETATQLNLNVAGSIGKTEIKRLLAEIDCGKISNIKEFKMLMEIAADLYFPEEHKYTISIIDDNTLVGNVLECYVHKNVSKAGTTDIHQCAAKTRFESWFKSFGLKGEISAEKNTNNCNGSCEIIFKIKW
jgi:hypothetical protein